MNSGYHKIKPKDVPERPISSSNFLEANKEHIRYTSYDGVELKTGQPVFQMAPIEGQNKVFLRKFQIVDLLGDGRIRIKSNHNINGVEHVLDIMVNANQVCVDEKFLVKDWINSVKYKKDVELVELEKCLYEIWFKNWPNELYDVSVGEGIQDIEI